MVIVYKSGMKQGASDNCGVLSVQQERRDRDAARGLPARVSIEQLLEWVYSAQKADKVSGLMVEDVVALAGGGWVFDRIGELGCMIDGGGPAGQDVDPDALAIHEAVCAYAALGKVEAMRAGLVVLYARAGVRPDVLTDEPPMRCYDRASYSYWAGDVELDFIPNSKMRRPAGYDGPFVRKGQACDVMFVRDYQTHENRLILWQDWAAGLEELHGRMPPLNGWRLRPFSLPAFVRSEGRAQI
ncbi:hypothetical protein SAMN04515647_4399 [Cohaesibacter sp. ES.047]|uniref:hypothetical protein n=1 Tax=Cohaesibacter sp. ES.047 TaxID=1798205 RepID=UPI000BB814AC|nr:hypothetical protein [Cohaesibacter sp. ES.047]SNY94075.1 hypothetical protein SAMN04515647_4399 [Cohaesibacter sp. ES.047]